MRAVLVDRVVEAFDAVGDLASTLGPVPEPGRSKVLAAVGRLRVNLDAAERRVNGTPLTGKPPVDPRHVDPEPAPPADDPPPSQPPSDRGRA